MSKFDEIIIVAPREKVFNQEELSFQGTLKDQEFVDEILSNIAENFTTMRRGNKHDPTPKEDNAEINLQFKQPIPYPFIRRGNEIYVYKRLSGGGESRLHNKLSIGIGGHMNPIENVHDFKELLTINMERELEEELIIEDKNFKVTPIGLINDDLDEVGEVHIGVLCSIEVSEDSEVMVRETDSLAGTWISLEELKEKEIYERLENWSKIAVDIL